ncbi:MAG TPA: class I SAM-dependent methyltransferase [Chloroflexota bacterium]
MTTTSTAIPCAHPEDRTRVLYAAHDYITGNRFEICRCDECGLATTRPAPSLDTISRYYPEGYYGQNRRYPRPLEWLLDRLYAYRARAIERVIGRSAGRALDIGCGRGSLLAHLRSRGWSVMGTELSEEGARYARDVLHLDVRTGDLREVDIDGRFDLIILWHVLEHVADPESVLHEAAQRLEPGGTTLVAVPNFTSFEAQWGKSAWFHLDVPRHVNHFTPRLLRQMLRREGLAPYASGYFAVEYDSFSFAQTALNMLGFQHNLFYDLIRTRGAKVLSANPRPKLRDIMLTLVLAPLLLAMSPPWIALVVLLRRGATIVIYARNGEPASE